MTADIRSVMTISVMTISVTARGTPATDMQPRQVLTQISRIWWCRVQVSMLTTCRASPGRLSPGQSPPPTPPASAPPSPTRAAGRAGHQRASSLIRRDCRDRRGGLRAAETWRNEGVRKTQNVSKSAQPPLPCQAASLPTLITKKVSRSVTCEKLSRWWGKGGRNLRKVDSMLGLFQRYTLFLADSARLNFHLRYSQHQ
jgi:hypothetical protein